MKHLLEYDVHAIRANAIIAEWCGWLDVKEDHSSMLTPPILKGFNGTIGKRNVVPDYTSDECAIQTAIMKLNSEGEEHKCFVENLLCCLTSFEAPPDDITSTLAFSMITAPPWVMCEALLRTIGKWEEVENV